MTTTAAHRTGSLIFCPACGTLLNLPKAQEPSVVCEQCGREESSSSYDSISITTRSDPDVFPSALRQKRKTQTKVHEEEYLKVTETCPECGHLEAYSREVQMRSADEGSTILYTCVSCKHGWRVDN